MLRVGLYVPLQVISRIAKEPLRIVHFDPFQRGQRDCAALDVFQECADVILALHLLEWVRVSQDLLIIDELGFVPLSKTGAGLLFEIVSQRYERGSIIITSNLPFDDWTEVFGSKTLDRSHSGLPDPSCAHPRNERREFLFASKPKIPILKTINPGSEGLACGQRALTRVNYLASTRAKAPLTPNRTIQFYTGKLTLFAPGLTCP